jgi:hypothetical protein
VPAAEITSRSIGSVLIRKQTPPPKPSRNEPPGGGSGKHFCLRFPPFFRIEENHGEALAVNIIDTGKIE